MTWVFLKMGNTVYTLVNWENIRYTGGIIGTLVLGETHTH